MRKMLIAAALGGMMILPACAAGGYYGAGYGGSDVYYDGYYGAYTDGYWGPDAAFYYRGGNGQFIRDESHHFQRGMFTGAHRFHSHAAPREGERSPR